MTIKLKPNKIKHIDNKTIGIIVKSKKYGEKICLIDAEDYSRLRMFKWHLVKNSKNFYLQSHLDQNNTILMHRLITSFPVNDVVDHIDGDSLNNKKINLRLCKNYLNVRNRLAGKNNLLGIKGVSFEHGKYKARITLSRKVYNLGTYKTKLEAILAYNNKAIELHGEYARLNDISLAD